MNSARYGTPPAPPPISAGSLPAQRLSTQTPQYNVGEAPACVQNAMMTKDKKPFTYTPGGIDLSQIKSPRMAQRLARNAQNEGATGQQQMNRPQSQSNGGSSPAAQLGATAMGMPFQVLPTGPPPPPPQPNKAGPPPPPPPSSQVKLTPQANGNATRKSPTPQNFEPPPMGFRPEIKIPPNPMAALKKVPPPQEKNNFWVEEYRKERSKSPMVGNDENDYNRSPPNNQQPETNQYTTNNYNQLPRQQNEYQSQQQRSPSPQPMRPQSDVSPPRTPVQYQQQYVQEPPRRTETPNQVQYSPQPQQQPQQFPAIQRQFSSNNQPQYQAPQSPQPQQQPQQSPPVQRQQQFSPPQQYQGPTSPQYQQPQQVQQQQQQQTVPWRTQRSVPPNAIQNNVSRPRDVMSPAPSESPRPQVQQFQPPPPAYLRPRDMLSPAPEPPQPPQVSQPYQQKNAQVGSIYIPPVTTQQQQQQQQQQLRQAPANRWGSTQTSPVDNQTFNRLKSPPPPSSNGFSSSNNTGLKLQINNNTSGSTGKERIIPIQLEQTPTPTRTPSVPGFGPQPYYNTNQQQYNSVPSPPLGQTSNDQGYNNYQDQNRVTSPARIIQQTNTVAGGLKERVIPIAVDTQPDGPLNPNNVRGPISKQPLVIQNDPRNQNPNAWGNGNTTPNQSRSFRILQKITDTAEDAASESKAIESDGGDPEPQLQRPTYARQMGPGQLTSPTIEQMKRMQLNNDQAFVNRTKNPENDVDQSVTVKADNVDPRYRGPTNPSITFKKLQGAIERCSPSRTDRDGTPPVMKQPQPNRYVNQRPVYSPEEQPQQYVHPSEQQVPEPKKYTGSAIPSRSFKILQAMTTPENAGPGQSDL